LGKLTTARLSDGRLQLWVTYPSILSSWQVSLDPTAAWWSLAPFAPSPGEATDVTAGHSPDGRAQLWALGYDNVLRTTWKVTSEPNSGWTPWETFLAHPDLGSPVAGQLSDGRMQIWAVDHEVAIWTTWKVSTEVNAPWSGWTQFSPAQPGAVLAAGNLSDGRPQLWAQIFTPSGVGFQTSGMLMSSWKATSDPGSAWNPWQIPFSPPLTTPAGGTSYTEACAAGQLSDGSLQLWACTSDGVLHTTRKGSASASAAWTPWQSPFLPAPGRVGDLTAGRLADGRLKLWVMTVPAANGTAQILTTQQESPAPGASWTQWTTVGTVG
jgi:hypothetical protein